MLLWQSIHTGRVYAGEVVSYEVGLDKVKVLKFTQTNSTVGDQDLERWVLSCESADEEPEGWRVSQMGQGDGPYPRNSAVIQSVNHVATTSVVLSQVTILACNFSLGTSGNLPDYVVSFANNRLQKIAYL